MRCHTASRKGRSPRRAIATLVLAAAGAAGCGGADETPAPRESAATPAPVATEASFRTLDGDPASLVDYRGRVVVLNLWGTWCVPCRRELPELVEVERAFADRGVTVIGLAIDSGEPAEIRDFLADYGVTYPIWMTDMPTALTEFGAVGYPFTLLIGRDGTIRHQFYGPQSLSTLAPRIEALLAD